MQPRNASVDILRFVAALAIVWFHLPLPGSSTALAALHVFILLQIVFGTNGELRAQTFRLLTPWVIWSGFYALAKIAQALVQGRPVAAEFEPWMLLTGASLHLWYLPFSLVALILAKVLLRLPRPIWQALCLISAVGAVAVANLTAPDIPWAQYVSVIPAVMLGVGLAGGLAPRWLIPGGVAVGLGAVFGFGWEAAAWQSTLAFAAVGAALALPLPSNRLTRWLGAVSFGVYLVHPAVFAVVLMVGPALQGGALFLCVASLSLIAVLALRRVVPVAVK